MKSKYQPGTASIAVALMAVILLISADVAAALLIARHSLDNDFTVGENISSIEEKFDEYDAFKAGETYEKKKFSNFIDSSIGNQFAGWMRRIKRGGC